MSVFTLQLRAQKDIIEIQKTMKYSNFNMVAHIEIGIHDSFRLFQNKHSCDDYAVRIKA